MQMSKQEKITINLSVVDLGKIDLLVEQGFYSNRTDFIKTAIRSQLGTHSKEIDQVVTEKSYKIGIVNYNRKSLENLVNKNKMLDVKVIGMLVLDKDVDLELAKKVFSSLRVNGVFKANREVKEYFS